MIENIISAMVEGFFSGIATIFVAWLYSHVHKRS